MSSAHVRSTVSKRRFTRALALAGGGAVLSLAFVGTSFATSIAAPTGNPYAVPQNATGDPQAFTVTVTGFSAGQSVYLEQCDGTDPASSGWSPATHCDVGTSPAAVIADGSGKATFEASDPNHAFHPVKGPSPSGAFNCLASGSPSPNNGVKDFTNCKLRASSNNTTATGDQVFLTLQLSGAGSAPPAQVAEVPIAIALPIGAVVVGGGFLWFRKRRHHARASA
jgi:hypothetical protein